MITPARPAVTTIVFRRDPDAAPFNYRVLFIRRPGKLTMGGIYAYPGGSVGPEDTDPEAHERCSGLDREARAFLAREAGTAVEPWQPTQFRSTSAVETEKEPPALAYWVAAARELFEEVGLLVARDAAGNPPAVEDAATARRLQQRREELLADRIPFGAVLRDGGWYLPVEAFTYFFRLVTPTYHPKRFDTRFFFVEAPAGQEPDPYTPEVEDMIWLSPAEALELYARDVLRGKGEAPRFPAIAPTLFTVNIMSRQRDIDAFLHAVYHGGVKQDK